MKIHQLAALLDSLRTGFGAGLKADVAGAFQEAAEALRELPDQTLKALVGQVRAKPAAGPGPGGRAGRTAVDVDSVIAAITQARAGGGADDALHGDIARLSGDQSKRVLRAFGGRVSGSVGELKARVRGLTAPSAEALVAPEPPSPAADPELVEQGYQTYVRLRDARALSVNDVRAEFQPVRAYPKAVLEAILRRVNFTPSGSRDDMAARLLSTLESIKMHQMREELILTGK